MGQQIKEVSNTNHEIDRIKDRLSMLDSNDLLPNEKIAILRNLSIIKNTNFDINKTYGIKVGGFTINPNSKYYLNINDKEYYRINDKFLKDSTGDEFWLIVRNNKVTTFMLRKSNQSNNVNTLKEKLRVSNIIFNIKEIKPLNENIRDKRFLKVLLREELIKEENKNIIIHELTEILGEQNKSLITESLVLDIIGLVKNFLTTHRTAELLTALTKLILKSLGVDSDMDGVKDNCNDNCSVLLIQKLSNKLHEIHHKVMDILTYISAIIKFKTLRPSDEQKNNSKNLANNVFNAFLIGCLIYYVKSFGINLQDLINGSENYLSLIIPSIGIISKTSELSKKFELAINKINTGVAVHP